MAALARLARLVARIRAVSQLESALLGIVTLMALLLRLLRLDFQPLWWDEGYSVWFATHPLTEMAALTALDIHPPLYYALLHGWIGLIGAGPVSLRLLSVIFGVLAIPAIYLAGRRLLGARAGLLAALLLAINPLHIYYSQEVRMYGLVALLSIGVLAAGWRLIYESANQQISKSTNHRVTVSPRHLVIYVLLTTAALYTQYYAVFLPIGLTLYVCWRRFGGFSRFRSSATRPAEASKPGEKPVSIADAAPEITPRSQPVLIRWLLAQAAVALLYLPWVIYAAPKLTLYISQKVVADADRPLGFLEYGTRHLAAFLAGHLPGALAPYWPLALLLLLPFGLGWGLLLWRDRVAIAQTKPTPAVTVSPCHPVTPSPCHLLATVTLTALALGWLISLRFPFFPEHGERLLLLALPAFILLLAAGLDALWASRPPVRIPEIPNMTSVLSGAAGFWLRSRRMRPVYERFDILRLRSGPKTAGTPLRMPPLLARSLARATLALIVAASAASLTAFYTVPRYPGDDYRPLIARTVEQGLPEDTVFAIYPWQAGYWRSYGSAGGPTARLTPDADWTPGVAAALDDALARGKVWFPAHLALGAILETQIETHLAGRGVPFINEWYGPGTRLSGWAITAAPQAVDAPAVRFPLRGADGAAELLGVEAARQPIPAANAVAPITLRWRVPAGAPTLRVAVSVRLVDSIGQIWAQHDYERISKSANRQANETSTQYALRNTSEDRLGLLIPAGTPPGRYFVEVAMHPKGDAWPLDVLAQDGRSLGAAARLCELTVAPADRDLDPERLPIGIRRPQDFADGLRLLGHTLDDRPVAPGEARPVNLFWQAAAQPKSEYVAFVQLLDGAGQLASLWEAPPGGAWATNAWPPGTLIRTQASIRPRADLPDGRYRLIAGLFRASDKARLRTTGGADHILLGEVTVRGRPHDRTRPQPQHAADVAFGQAGRLIGYDLAEPGGDFRPGGTIPLTLYWQANAATERPHTVFVHLVDAAGAIHGYGDREPGDGRLPTTSWLAGEYLTDPHQVNASSAAPAGAYRLRIGLYDPTTGQRLATPEGKDHTEIGPVTIR